MKYLEGFSLKISGLSLKNSLNFSKGTKNFRTLNLFFNIITFYPYLL